MELRLTLRIQPSDLSLVLHNPTGHPVRVWQLGNSWGGNSWSVRVSTPDPPERWYTLRPSNQGYTRNVPRFIEVPPHGQQEVRLTPSRPEWTAGEDLETLRQVPVNVQAVLGVVASPESEKHGVAVGRIESATVRSTPPHAWLFAVAPGR